MRGLVLKFDTFPGIEAKAEVEEGESSRLNQRATPTNHIPTCFSRTSMR